MHRYEFTRIYLFSVRGMESVQGCRVEGVGFIASFLQLTKKDLRDDLPLVLDTARVEAMNCDHDV